MDIPSKQKKCKHKDRPGPCPVCGLSAWWNGARKVKQVVKDAMGAVVRLIEVLRRRARCSDRSCQAGSWTIYEEGGYPHRRFALAVVVSAVAQVVCAWEGGRSVVVAVPDAAERHQCDPSSMSRWIKWVAGLFVARDLARLCSRLDPDGLPPPEAPTGGACIARAGVMLRLLERLAQLLRFRGVEIEPGPGLAAILRRQLVRFGRAVGLTESSPPMKYHKGGF